MNKFDVSHVTHAQLRDLAEALDGALATRKDLADVATAIEEALPEILARSVSPPVERCNPPTSFRLTIHRNEDGEMTEVLVRPLGVANEFS